MVPLRVLKSIRSKEADQIAMVAGSKPNKWR